MVGAPRLLEGTYEYFGGILAIDTYPVKQLCIYSPKKAACNTVAAQWGVIEVYKYLDRYIYLSSMHVPTHCTGLRSLFLVPNT